MKKYFLLGFILVSQMIMAQTAYPPLTPDQAAQILQQMNQAIVKQEALVKQYEDLATRRDLSPTWDSKLQLQNGIIQLEVKKTLVNNFKDTQSLRSPLVVQLLLQILNQESISTGDLANLQSLVLQEKANIQAYDNQQQINANPPSTTAPIITPPTTTTPATTPAPTDSSGVIIPSQ